MLLSSTCCRLDYALHPDGQRVAMAVAPETDSAKIGTAVLIPDFFDERARLASKE